MQEQHPLSIIVLDLDNTVWYGNIQRYGHLFSELFYRIKNTLAFHTSIHFPFEEFLNGWSVYTTTLHLTAPQQLDLCLDLLRRDGFLRFAHEAERVHVRQTCVEWMESRYWELVNHPEQLYIADQASECGRRVCLVPGVERSLAFLRHQKMSRGFKIYALSFNLRHLSQNVLNRLAIADMFDEIHGVSWNQPSSTKEETLRKILLEQHANGSQAVVIGDAVGDIAAGKAVGAKTVAVVTGPTPYAELLACKPDKIFTRWPEQVDEIEAIFFF